MKIKKEQLEKLKETELGSLKEHILDYVIENYDEYDNVADFIKDILKNGCQSGMVGHLIYYKDTNEFYDKYENEIEDKLEEYGTGCGYENRFQQLASLNGSDNVGNIMQEKNLLAWFGFEETLRDIADELECEN